MPGMADSVELERFREQWKAEVKQRTQVVTAPLTSPPGNGTSSLLAVDTSPSEPAVPPPLPHAPTPTPSYGRARSSDVSLHSFRGLSSAVQTYRLAVQHEQAGNLDDALRLYRNAFKLDSNVDKAYQKEELRLNMASKQPEGLRNYLGDVHADEQDNGLKRIVLPLLGAVTGELSSLISTFPPDLKFELADERDGFPLRMLPDELFVLILKTLDPTSIERFAATCRKARIVSLDSSIWRFLVSRTYIPPQVPEELDFDSIANQYMDDHRRFFIQHPRVRLDGVYIAVCHYIRPGMSENAWVHINHLITYHRYLRFFPDGIVLSLLANDAVEPRSVIPLLKPALRMKGLLIGTWSLLGAIVLVTGLTDPSAFSTRYTFEMKLTLRSRPSAGRWNVLAISEYNSANSDSGEIVPLALKHERPFWFSKVRSYSC